MIFPDSLRSVRSISRHLPYLLALVGIVALIWWLTNGADAWQFSLEGWRGHHEYLLNLVRDHPRTATAALFLMHVLLATLGLPGASLLMLVAGAGFGAIAGTLLCLTACTVGASMSMLAVRHFLQPLVRRKMGGRLAGFDRRIASDGVAYLFSLRLLPVIPFVLVNLAAGLSGMKAWTFTWVSFVGMLAGTFVYVNAGSELARIEAAGDIYSPRVLFSLAALALPPWVARLAQGAWQRSVGSGA
jgi:uncharacterized membrane protein YdjX (TVP38/TMEM64 family)